MENIIDYVENSKKYNVAISNFEGVEHRIEFIREIKGVIL